jgi:hypothetical protein
MDSALSILCNQIQTATGLSIAVGHPELVKTQLVLWPWRIAPTQLGRNTPYSIGLPDSERMMAVSLLLLSNAGLTCLAQATKQVAERPVFTVDDSKYSIKEQDLSAELQVAIFNAAGIPLQPAMSYVLEG